MNNRTKEYWDTKDAPFHAAWWAKNQDWVTAHPDKAAAWLATHPAAAAIIGNRAA